ncbi:hypothetical protein TEA_015560 [Camellia sinensis var. sinensis]|uniref:(S)-2-hydroxy-acid oxidase n=1 Tax=Camellia sinensis var. sinensis TaxID=542762 RepID=A0A4S4CYC5_CAMSN|nr:hypothetical protein TEA_015560 [Camellia sinensis var. sinensis]
MLSHLLFLLANRDTNLSQFFIFIFFWDFLSFRPRVLVDVSRIDMSTTILGYPTSAPIMIAPTGLHKLAHPEGEVATARAAAACNTIMAMSFAADCTVEEVASSFNAIRFFQTYVCKRRDVTVVLVQRAERNGFKAIMLTVDTPRLGRREADIKNKMIAPQQKNLEGLLSTEAVSDNGSKLAAFAAETLDPSLCWKDIDWLKSVTNLPILVKGVLTAEDAIKAMEVGVAGIVVSNHGARQLDYSPATITVLEEDKGSCLEAIATGMLDASLSWKVVRAVGGKNHVLFDGGVRRGTDISKVGRPVIYGLAAKGEYGVRRVIEMLKDELELTIALSGCPTVNDIIKSLSHEQYTNGNNPLRRPLTNMYCSIQSKDPYPFGSCPGSMSPLRSHNHERSMISYPLRNPIQRQGPERSVNPNSSRHAHKGNMNFSPTKGPFQRQLC